MDTVLKITPRTVYGVEKYYPANEQAAQFAALVGQTTLTQDQLVRILSMGYKIEIVSPITALKLDN